MHWGRISIEFYQKYNFLKANHIRVHGNLGIDEPMRKRGYLKLYEIGEDARD